MVVCGASVVTTGGVILGTCHLDPAEANRDPTSALFSRAAEGSGALSGDSTGPPNTLDWTSTVVAAGTVANARVFPGALLSGSTPGVEPQSVNLVIVVWHLSRVRCPWAEKTCETLRDTLADYMSPQRTNTNGGAIDQSTGTSLSNARTSDGTEHKKTRPGADGKGNNTHPPGEQAAADEHEHEHDGYDGHHIPDDVLETLLAKSAWIACGGKRRALVDCLPDPPSEPEAEECCGTGCFPCVFDRFETAMERHDDLRAHVESVACTIELMGAPEG